MEKIVLTTGGTGGHIFPALAVAEELRDRRPDISLHFIGSLHGPEARLASQNGIPFEGLEVRGLLGRGLRAIPAAFDMIKAIWQAHSFLSNFKPDAVAGFGGYASFAPMCAARILGIPTLLHEQNIIAGSGNRFLARFADKICISLAGTKGLPENAILTGNPVRKSIRQCSGKGSEKTGKKHLLVLGGSQGAHALNVLMKEILPQLRERGIDVRHQCGNADLGMVRDYYAENGYFAGLAQARLQNWVQLACPHFFSPFLPRFMIISH